MFIRIEGYLTIPAHTKIDQNHHPGELVDHAILVFDVPVHDVARVEILNCAANLHRIPTHIQVWRTVVKDRCGGVIGDRQVWMGPLERVRYV